MQNITDNQVNKTTNRNIKVTLIKIIQPSMVLSKNMIILIVLVTCLSMLWIEQLQLKVNKESWNNNSRI